MHISNSDPNYKRSPRVQRLASHLHAAGARPVLEALLAVAAGQPIDSVLEDFARLPVALYAALGADQMPIDELMVVNGGRS